MPDIDIALIAIGERHRRDFGDIESLAASIKRVGLIHPICIDSNYRLIAGERRLLAYKQLGHDRILATILPIANILQGEKDENDERKDFTVSEQVAIGEALEQEMGERRTNTKNLDQENFPGLGDTRDLAAKQAGFNNGKTYEQAKKVVTHAEPEVVEAMDNGQIAISTAAEATALEPDDQREVAAMPKSKQRQAIAEKKQMSPAFTETGNDECYTPSSIIEAAREVMGAIDLDPASCAAAQQTVKAGVYFSSDDDGLSKIWGGRVWLNPPYSRGVLAKFADKLNDSINSGNITSAIVLVNSGTETGWFHRIASACNMICLPSSRINFTGPNGKIGDGNSRPQTVLYFGDDDLKFTKVFSQIGLVYSRVAP